MDLLLFDLREIKARSGYQGALKEFRGSKELVDFCIKNSVIAKVAPVDLPPEERERFTAFLVAQTRAFLTQHKDVNDWKDFVRMPEVRRIHKMLFEYGIRAEVFPEAPAEKGASIRARSATSLTLPELYEVCQFKLHFSGSFLSFKRLIQRQYGSFAEYCLLKGYDINTTKWESDETAIRVARKIGSMENVKAKSKSLYSYINEKNLEEFIFGKKTE